MKFGVLFTLFLSVFAYGTCERKGIIRQHPLVVAELESSVILSCSYSFDMIQMVSWYKQTAGKNPLLIAYSSYHSKDFIYEKGFDQRYLFKVGTDFCNMSIIKVKENDFASYYCGVTSMYTVQFGEGTILLRKGEDSASGATVLQQPVSDRLHPGDSVTLQCSVISQICAGEYSVFWFQHSSGHYHPEIIYTHGNRRDQCMKRSENASSSKTCFYSLSQTELRSSDAGIYYCAVATCGKVHLGNGTKLIIEEYSTLTFWSPVVLTLFTISIISIIVNIFLVRLNYKNHNKEASKLPRNQRNQKETDALNYVALSFSKKPTTSTRSAEKTSQEETLYSQITKQ